MKKYAIQILIASGIIALGLAIFFGRGEATIFTKKNVVEYTNLVHGELFREATDQWNANLQIKQWRPSDIGGQEIGSSSALRFEWESPTQTFNHFLITLTDPVSGVSKTESRIHDAFSVDILKLFPDTKYHVVLQACLNPTCSSWFIADEESVGRTPQTYWKMTDELSNEDISKFTRIENYIRRFNRSRLNLFDQDGVALDQEQKNQLTLQAVSYKDGIYDQYIELSRDKTPIYAKLLNP